MKTFFLSSRSMTTYKAQNMVIHFPVLIFLSLIHARYVPHLSQQRFRTSHPKPTAASL